jgi:hypothetical protein
MVSARVQLGSKQEKGRTAGNNGKQRACGSECMSPEPGINKQIFLKNRSRLEKAPIEFRAVALAQVELPSSSLEVELRRA